MRRVGSVAVIVLGASLWVACSGSSFADLSNSELDDAGSDAAVDAKGDARGDAGARNDAEARNDAQASDDATAGTAPGAPVGIGAAAVPLDVSVTTFAGSGLYTPFADGAGATATFSNPDGLAVDAAGNVQVADTFDDRIRKVTPAGVVTTLAGSGESAFADGTGATAKFNAPAGAALDAAGNLFVSDYNNNRIRKVTAGGVVTTLAGSGTAAFADGTGIAASFDSPEGIAVDATGNVYVADSSNNRIRKVTVGGVVTTVAGSGTAAFADGTGVAASFDGPNGLAMDASGNLYVADQNNHRIRKVTPAGVVTTLAGSGTAAFADGTGAAASFNLPHGVGVDASGNVYVTDEFNQRIRKVTPAGVTTTIAGSGADSFADGVGAAAGFSYPYGVTVDAAGLIYVADNNRVRKLTPVGGGELAVAWSAGTSGSSPITGYVASATATSHATKTCMTTGATECTIRGLTTGVVYSVSVSATNAVGTSAVSPSVSATPN